MGRYVFKVPDIGEGTAEAEIGDWHIEVGKEVAEDDLIVEMLTDKATVEITSPVSGKVVQVFGEKGDKRPIGSELIVFEVEGAGNAGEATAPAPSPAAEKPPVPATTPPKDEPPQTQVPKVDASPRPAGKGRYVFKVPDIGEGTAEAEIGDWHVVVGKEVSEDDLLVEMLTDKATVEITSPVTGKVIQVFGEKGEKRPIGSELIVFEVDGTGNTDDAPDLPADPVSPSAPSPQAPPPAKPEPVKAPAPKPAAAAPAKAPSRSTAPAFATRTPGEPPQASPAVRLKARENGVELPFVPGSGPGGRITMDDLDAFIASGGVGAVVAQGGPVSRRREGADKIKVIGLRRKIAERLQDTKRRIPHFSYIEEVDVTALEDLRRALNDLHGKSRPKLTLLPFLVKALTAVLPDFPQINATFDDANGIVQHHKPVHAGIATQTPNGLMVTVLQHAEDRSLWDTAAEVSRLSSVARAGKATKGELSGSTITITSLGAIGGVATTPVMNSPEVAIIGVNKILERPVVLNGQIVVRKMMNLSSSFDHRVVDGWDAALFVQKIKQMLEQPAMLFMEDA